MAQNVHHYSEELYSWNSEELWTKARLKPSRANSKSCTFVSGVKERRESHHPSCFADCNVLSLLPFLVQIISLADNHGSDTSTLTGSSLGGLSGLNCGGRFHSPYSCTQESKAEDTARFCCL